MKKTYNEIVSIARSYARDNVRLQLTNKVRNELLVAENSVKSVDEDIAKVTKNITRLDYKISKVDSENPDAVEIVKDLDEQKVYATKQIEELNKEKECYTKKIASLTEEITNIQNGSKKVSTETLSAVSSEYLNVLTVELMMTEAKEVKTDDILAE